MYQIDFRSLDNVRRLSSWCRSAAKSWLDDEVAELERKFDDLAAADASEGSFTEDELQRLSQVCNWMANGVEEADEWERFFDDELAAIRVANAA